MYSITVTITDTEKQTMRVPGYLIVSLTLAEVPPDAEFLQEMAIDLLVVRASTPHACMPDELLDLMECCKEPETLPE